MDLTEKLMAIEEIKILKARYCRFVDDKNWEELFALFTSDAVLDYSSVREKPYTLKEAREMIPATLKPGLLTVHQGFMPEIEILSPTQATGIWAMEDRIFGYGSEGDSRTKRFVNGLGRYYETYRREGGRWLIEKLRLTRVWREEENLLTTLYP